ncbi:MAG: AAA family ATPase [Chthonomonadales bacterium]|nr:AAA family ATPase [Chthonomonadales bacterium]
MLAPAGGAPLAEVAKRLAAEMHKAIVGQEELVEMLAVALLSRGHVLLEGVPGTAKTLAVRTFARLCSVSFARIQFTPDLMPSDVLGTNVYDPRAGVFAFRPGPLFAGLVLADEVNRTPPKTQAALLEAMEERRATIDGVSHPMPEPFMVCATQNPVEYEGTYPLPEAQLDRFMLKVVVDYPSEDEEIAILARYQSGFRAQDLDTAGLRAVLSLTDLPALWKQVEAVDVAPPVRKYIADVARVGRSNRHLTLGPSPRAAITLMLAARALAAVRGRAFVTPDDVKGLAHPVLRHRVLLRPESEIEGYTADRVLDMVLESVDVPR